MSDLFSSQPAQAKQTQRQTGATTVTPSAEQQKLLDLALPAFEKFAAAPPSPFPGQTTAGFTPSQIQGQQQVLGAVPAQQQIAAGALGAQGVVTDPNILNAATNPALQSYINAATQPLYQQLTEAALPAIRGSAITSGGFGGSRQGIAEGLATGRTAQAAGETTANIANQGYQAGLDALLKGIALAPTTQQVQTQPGLTTSGVGDVQQALQQAILNQQIQDYYYKQFAPFMTAQELTGIATGLPGGTTTTRGRASGVSTAPGAQQDPFSTAIGAAATILPMFF